MERYCTVRIKSNDGDFDDELAYPDTFGEVLTILKQVRDQHADEYADTLVEDPETARSLAGDVSGGFGVEVTNRWGGIVEVALGRDACCMFRHHPLPPRCHSDHPPIQGTRVFYLDGGHHTELPANMLVSLPECLRALREWLETGGFPDKNSADCRNESAVEGESNNEWRSRRD